MKHFEKDKESKSVVGIDIKTKQSYSIDDKINK